MLFTLGCLSSTLAKQPSTACAQRASSDPNALSNGTVTSVASATIWSTLIGVRSMRRFVDCYLPLTPMVCIYIPEMIQLKTSKARSWFISFTFSYCKTIAVLVTLLNRFNTAFCCLCSVSISMFVGRGSPSGLHSWQLEMKPTIFLSVYRRQLTESIGNRRAITNCPFRVVLHPPWFGLSRSRCDNVFAGFRSVDWPRHGSWCRNER